MVRNVMGIVGMKHVPALQQVIFGNNFKKKLKNYG